jgi:metal transporter CNNM
LTRKAKLGDADAARVLPLRKNLHLSLVSILFTNVAVISATSLLLGSYLVGLIAGVVSTVTIVIFGEILPQALFAKRALRWTAALAPFLRFIIIVTYPVARPLQSLLDKLVGPDGSSLHSRQELGLLIAEHTSSQSEIDNDEVEIIKGALQLSEKTVADIMTPMKRVISMRPDTIINSTKIQEIKRMGHSRIPVFNSAKTTCEGVLLVKDMVDVDFDETPTKVSEMVIRPTKQVGSRTALDTLFRKFIGARSHLMPVVSGGKIVGIVTIEDLIEEILGHEIEDETDVPPLTKNKRATSVR